MFLQVGSFFTSNLSSDNALQQDFVIRKVGSKHLMMNILSAVHSVSYFSFAVTMSEINPTDHKSISAPLFPNEGFREAVRELVGSERDNKRVEAEFSRFMDLTNRVHHVRCRLL